MKGNHPKRRKDKYNPYFIILSLAQRGIEVQKPEDVIKSTYTLEFLNLPESSQYTESDLEQRLIDNLPKFLLELGKGFTFVGRQYKITINNVHYHVDLVFYHRILKCFVLMRRFRTIGI